MDWLKELVERFPELKEVEAELAKARDIMVESAKNGGQVLICGNGGSASDSEHIVGELMKSFDRERPMDTEIADRLRKIDPDAEELIGSLQGAVPAIALNAHTALTTAFMNDVDPDMVFAQQVYGYGRKGDVLIALSTSGNSKNVVNACRIAKAMDVQIISITGQKGGKLKGLADAALCVPADRTYKIQEFTLPIYHMLCHEVEDAVFGSIQ